MTRFVCGGWKYRRLYLQYRQYILFGALVRRLLGDIERQPRVNNQIDPLRGTHISRSEPRAPMPGYIRSIVAFVFAHVSSATNSIGLRQVSALAV